MAYAIGTATDYIDMMRKLRDFATGALDPTSHVDFTAGSGPVGSGDQWTKLTNGPNMMAELPVSGMATDGELYLQGQGSDPSDEIIIGFRTYRNAGNNIYAISSRGFTAWNDQMDWTTLPGASPSCYTPLRNVSMNIWFWVNRRRIMAAARTGTYDVIFHSGFIRQFGTRGQYPYPLYIAGAAETTAENYQTANFNLSCLPDPRRSYLRWVDGSWVNFFTYSSNNAVRATARSITGSVVWPCRNPLAIEGSEQTATSSRVSEDSVFQAFTTNSGPYISRTPGDNYALFPSCLVTSASGGSLVGQIDGLYTLFGGGLSKGDTLVDSSVSPANTYDVFGNTWRNEPVDFFAVLRE